MLLWDAFHRNFVHIGKRNLESFSRVNKKKNDNQPPTIYHFTPTQRFLSTMASFKSLT